MRFLLALIISFSFFSAQAKPTPVTEARPAAAIKKLKLLRSNPHRYTAINLAGADPWQTVDDEDIMPQRRYRLELKPDSDEVSDHVRFRLWLARQLAMKKFAEVHGNLV
jgi:hypothetical protein